MNKKGFTILEILTVVIIILMLSLLIIPIIDRNIRDTEVFLTQTQIEMIENAAYLYYISYKDEIPEINTEKIAIISIQTLLDKGLIEERSIKSNNQFIIPPENTVLIIDINDKIITVYDKTNQSQPLLYLNGPEQLTITKNTSYLEYGAFLITFSPNKIEELDSTYISSGVNNVEAGKYTVEYSYPQAESVTRIVYVSDAQSDIDEIIPEITLIGSSEITISQGETFSDPGATAIDNVDGNITSRIQITGTVNTTQKGTYYLKYDVTDLSGNRAETVTRRVIVN